MDTKTHKLQGFTLKKQGVYYWIAFFGDTPVYDAETLTELKSIVTLYTGSHEAHIKAAKESAHV